MIVVIADAKNHDDNSMHIQFFESRFEQEKKADIFLVANTGYDDLETYKLKTGFQNAFGVKRNNVLTVCTGTPKSNAEVQITQESELLHKQVESGTDERKKASVVIIKHEQVNSGFGPIMIANVQYGTEFSSEEGVSILIRMAPLLVDWNNGKAMIAFNFASPITKKCAEVMEQFLDDGSFDLLDNYEDAKRHLRSGLLVTIDLQLNDFGEKDGLYRDKNDGKMKTFVMEYYRFVLSDKPSPSVPLPSSDPPAASSRKNTKKRGQYPVTSPRRSARHQLALLAEKDNFQPSAQSK